MPLTSLNPNLLGQDSTGASKLNTAGGTAQLHSTGLFAIANNSANNFAVANNGNVGVGTASPDNGVRLDVRDNSGFAAIQLAGTGIATGQLTSDGSTQLTLKNVSNGPLLLGSNNTTRAFIAANGNIGIGITAPTTTLHTKAPAFTDGIITIDATSTNVSQRLNLAANGTIQTQLYDDSSQTILKSVTAKPLYLGANNSNIITVAANGNIGINTTSPGTKLDVVGTSVFRGTAGGRTLGISEGSTSTIGFLIEADTNAGDLTLSSAYSAGYVAVKTAGSERMRFAANGNVGVGTSSPGAKVDVAGAIRLKGYQGAAGTLGDGYNASRFWIELQGYAANQVTQKLFYADDNAAFKITYIGHWYNAGAGSASMLRAVEFYGAIGSGGAGETGLDYYFVNAANYGTAGNTDTPSFSISGDAYVQITYGTSSSTSINSRGILVEWFGSGLPTFHSSVNAPT